MTKIKQCYNWHFVWYIITVLLLMFVPIVHAEIGIVMAAEENCTKCSSGTFDENGFCTDVTCGGYEQPKADEEGVYQIANAGNLYWFSGLVNGSPIVCATYTDGEENINYVVEKDITANAVLQNDIMINANVLRRNEDNSLYVNEYSKAELQDRTDLEELQTWVLTVTQ